MVFEEGKKCHLVIITKGDIIKYDETRNGSYEETLGFGKQKIEDWISQMKRAKANLHEINT